MKINSTDNLTFGWNKLSHVFIAKKALSGNNALSKDEIDFISQHSKDPDILPTETVDRCARHFYDVLHEDPSFGTINDDLNNALSGFLNHNKEAIIAAKEGNRKQFLLKIAHAVHYLQDASTPMHVEHGNYFKMFLRLPIHILFERGKKFGATTRLKKLEKGFKPEELPVTSLYMLFTNTALFAIQPENKVKLTNIRHWFDIQQRCINRGINASKAYFDYIMKFLPKSV